MRRRAGQLLGWAALALAVFLGARALSYALVPHTALGAELADRGGGPPVAVLAVALPLLALAFGAAVAALTHVGVAERHRLSGEGAATAPPPVDVRAIARRTGALTGASAVLFAGVESYVHWRAGLGFHGLHCLLGPVHRDALPFLFALSLLAAAGSVAAAHVLAWLRRAAPLAVAPRPTAARAAPVLLPPPARPRARRAPRPGGSRAPPARGVLINPST